MSLVDLKTSFTSVLAGACCLAIIALSNGAVASPPVVDLSQTFSTSAASQSPVRANVTAVTLAPPEDSTAQTYGTTYPSDNGQATWQEQSASTSNALDSPPPPPPAPSSQQLVPPGAVNGGFNPSTMSVAARLQRVEQQVQNLANMNMPQQIGQLQQQIQQQNGQLQQQAHEIELLKKKLHRLQSAKPADKAPIAATSTAVSTASTAAHPVLSEDDLPAETKAYQDAFRLLSQKQYQAAIIAFNRYLQHYPQGKFAANTHYWLGELYLLNDHWVEADNQFSALIYHYPDSPKIADARLKRASIHVRQGKVSLARDELQHIQVQYAGTATARLAHIQLQQLDLSRGAAN